jgi:hypothetical protein
MKYPTIARDFVAAASTCQEPVKLNMALKLPNGMHSDTPDFLLKYSAIWNFKCQRHPLNIDKLKHKELCYVIRRNNPKHQCKHDSQHTKIKNKIKIKN